MATGHTADEAAIRERISSLFSAVSAMDHVATGAALLDLKP